MGNNVSEGAIVQHLAKLRSRRVASNKQVPPPLRRGGSGSAAKASSTSTSPTKGSAEASSPKEQTKTKARKAADSSDEEDIPVVDETSDESEEYGSRRRSKKSGKKKSRKRRKLDVDTEPDSDHAEDGDDELLAVGAQFLNFPGDKHSSRSASPSEDDVAREKPSKIVILRYGRHNATLVPDDGSFSIDNEKSGDPKNAVNEDASQNAGYANGSGPSKDQAAEDFNVAGLSMDEAAGYFSGNGMGYQTTAEGSIPPPSGADAWEESIYDEEGYVKPVPKVRDPNNPLQPYLTAGKWPRDVILRQYDRDDPRIPGVPPVPKTVIPAAWLREENCEPALLFNRVLDNAREETYPESREHERKRPEYKEYMAAHRELPYFFEPHWNLPPTLHITDPNDDYKIHTFLTDKAADPEPLREQHSNFNALDLRVMQLDREIEKGNMLDMNRLIRIREDLDQHAKLPPGKCYNLMEELTEEDVVHPYGDWVS
ncbi:hypothetical protein VTN96DRAFT_10411 [Rasamsonia emersonii]